MNEQLLIGMEPIADPLGFLYVFFVESDGVDRWLDGCYGRPDDFWRGYDRWVFALSK